MAELVGPGRKLRWVALAALAALAVRLALPELSRLTRPLALTLGLAGWLVALALASSAWSVDPRLTFAKACSLGLALLAAGSLAVASLGRPRLPSALLHGALGGAAATAIGGLFVLAANHAEAVQPASTTYGARFRGLGENPDTVPLLFGLLLPAAVWAAMRARGSRERVAGVAVLLLMLGTIVASDSRGGLLGALTGCLVLVLVMPVSVTRRLASAAAVCVVFVGCVSVARLSKPLPYAQPPNVAAPGNPGSPGSPGSPGGTPGQPRTHAEAVAQDAGYGGRLEDELDRGPRAARSLLTSSGRAQAWEGAVTQIGARPIAGYGFGTENRVFVDRFYTFQGGEIENSYLGFTLQLGVVGIVSLLVFLGGIAVSALVRIRRLTSSTAVEAALLACAAAGSVLMLVQSYIYAIGNVAAVMFWVAWLLLGATARGAVDAAEPGAVAHARA